MHVSKFLKLVLFVINLNCINAIFLKLFDAIITYEFHVYDITTSLNVSYLTL